MECEEADRAPRSLLCLTAGPHQGEASVLIKLKILLDYILLSVCDSRRSVGFTVDSYQVFGAKTWISFHGVMGDANLNTWGICNISGISCNSTMEELTLL